MIEFMTRFSEKLTAQLEKVGLNPYSLHKQSGVHKQLTYAVCWGERRPTDEVLEKFALVEQLGLALKTMQGWRALDEYSEEALIEAISAISKEEKRNLKARADKERAGNKNDLS